MFPPKCDFRTGLTPQGVRPPSLQHVSIPVKWLSGRSGGAAVPGGRLEPVLLGGHLTVTTEIHASKLMTAPPTPSLETHSLRAGEGVARTWPCWAPHSICLVSVSSCRVDSTKHTCPKPLPERSHQVFPSAPSQTPIQCGRCCHHLVSPVQGHCGLALLTGQAEPQTLTSALRASQVPLHLWSP